MPHEDIARAVRWATKLHDGQWLEGESPLPYISHPMEVLANLRYTGKETSPDMLCAAALHDIVEAGGASLAEIQERFGPRVETLVRELTRTEPTLEQTAGMSKDEVWVLRHDLLLEEIARQSPAAQEIKLADRLSNIRAAIRNKQGPKLDRYVKHTERVLAIIPREVSPPLWDAISKLTKRRVCRPLRPVRRW